MRTELELVMYTRTRGCPFVSVARLALARTGVPYREINIRENPQAHQRCLEWNRNLSMPVIVIARRGEDVPIEPPSSLELDQSPRDLDRGYLIAEPGREGLQTFLARHGFLVAETE